MIPSMRSKRPGDGGWFVSHFMANAVAVGYLSKIPLREKRWAQNLRTRKFPTAILPWEWRDA